MQTTYQRINITLPTDTLRLLERTIPVRRRSRVINAALRSYIGAHTRTEIRESLKESALSRAREAREISEAWLPLAEEAWKNQLALWHPFVVKFTW